MPWTVFFAASSLQSSNTIFLQPRIVAFVDLSKYDIRLVGIHEKLVARIIRAWARLLWNYVGNGRFLQPDMDEEKEYHPITRPETFVHTRKPRKNLVKC